MQTTMVVTRQLAINAEPSTFHKASCLATPAKAQGIELQ
jgi:hypothetical protein